MNIDKAIKIKLQWRKDNYPPALPSEMNADMLSIEALKRIDRYRRDYPGIHDRPLPGEIEE